MGAHSFQKGSIILIIDSQSNFTMSNKRTLYLIFSFFLLPLFSFSQSIRNFTPDAVKFIGELQQFFDESNKKESEELMKQFTPVWNSGKLSPQQQEAVYKTANAMLRKRMKPFPD